MRWLIIPPPLPSGTGVVASLEHLGLFPVIPLGNSYILLFMDQSSRCRDVYAVSSADCTAEGTAGILVNKHIHTSLGVSGQPPLRYRQTIVLHAD